MSKKLSGRYCNCHAPDPKRGYCQNCGEKSWPESTQYEDLRGQIDLDALEQECDPAYALTLTEAAYQRRILELIARIRELESRVNQNDVAYMNGWNDCKRTALAKGIENV